MRNILLIGAGKSSSWLIRYLLEKSTSENLFIIVADVSLKNAQDKIHNHKNAKALNLNIFNNEAICCFWQ